MVILTASAEPALSHNGGQHRQWSGKIVLVGFLCSIQRKVLRDTVGKSTIPPEKWWTRGDQGQKKKRHKNEDAWLQPSDVITKNKVKIEHHPPRE
jgi:hypothetical protein